MDVGYKCLQNSNEHYLNLNLNSLEFQYSQIWILLRILGAAGACGGWDSSSSSSDFDDDGPEAAAAVY